MPLYPSPAATTCRYDADGNLLTMVEPNVPTASNSTDIVTATYQYDDLNRLTSLTDTTASLATLYSFTYTYRADGLRTSSTEQINGSTNTTSWTYDNLDRLTAETYSSTGSPSTNYSATYTYDSNGSLIQSQTTSGTQTTTNTYSYDARGRLLTAQVNGQTVSYTYDNDGNKISETAGALVTMYTIDEDNPTGYSQVLEERTGTTTNPPTSSSPVTTSYAIGNGLIAQSTFFVNAGQAGVRTAYFLTDGHGSTRELFLPDGSGLLPKI